MVTVEGHTIFAARGKGRSDIKSEMVVAGIELAAPVFSGQCPFHAKPPT